MLVDNVLFAFVGVRLIRFLLAERIFAGYMTLFSFLNPIAGCKERVCQAMVLPPFQGRGLGRRMLLFVYRLCGANPEVAEVTVEDPCPSFQLLRDRVDLEWLWNALLMQEDGRTIVSSTDGSILDSRDAVSKKLKITTAQADFVLEAFDYIKVINSVSVGPHRDDADDHEQSPKRVKRIREIAWKEIEATKSFSDFRLRVKRRLLRTYPELRDLPKKDMQTQLSALFEEEQVRLRRIEDVTCNGVRISNVKTVSP